MNNEASVNKSVAAPCCKEAWNLITQKHPDAVENWTYVPVFGSFFDKGHLEKVLGSDTDLEKAGLLSDGALHPELRETLNNMLLPVLGYDCDADNVQDIFKGPGKNGVIRYGIGNKADGYKFVEYQSCKGEQKIVIHNVSEKNCRNMQHEFGEANLKIRDLPPERPKKSVMKKNYFPVEGLDRPVPELRPVDQVALKLIVDPGKWTFVSDKRGGGGLVKTLGYDETLEDRGLLEEGALSPEVRTAFKDMLVPVLGWLNEGELEEKIPPYASKGNRIIEISDTSSQAGEPIKKLQYHYGDGRQTVRIEGVTPDDCRAMEEKFRKYRLKISGLPKQNRRD